MRLARRGVTTVALLAAGVLAAGGAAAGEPLTVTTDAGDGFSLVQTAVDGPIVATAVARRAGGDAALLVLVGAAAPVPAEGDPSDTDASVWPRPCPADLPPLRLVRAATAPGRTAALLRADIPADATGLEALDLDGDGTDERILLRPGSATRLGADAAADVVLVEHEALGRGERVERRRRWPGLPGDLLAVNGPDGITLWRAADGRLAPLADVAARRGAAVWQDVLLAGTRRVGYAGRSDAGLQFVSRPTAEGGPDRLRTERIAVAPDGTATTEDRWLRLPAAEDLIEYDLLLLGGAPHLLVATKKGGALGITAEKLLRLYDLTTAGARLGIEPRFTAESRMNLWQVGTYRLLDVTGDGRDDLIVGYWKGLSDDRVVLDVYAGTTAGFRPSARTTAFDVKDGDRSFVGYGDDVNGDGLPDLLMASAGRLAVHVGTRSSSGAKLVTTRAVPTSARIGGDEVEFFVSAGSGGTEVHSVGASAPPWVVDLGDGPAIVTVAAPDGDLAAAVAVVRIDAAR